MNLLLRCLAPTLALVWTGCEEVPLVRETSEEHLDEMQAEGEMPPLEENVENKGPTDTISKEEGGTKLAALMERLEDAREEAVRAEDDLPLVFGAVADSKGNRYVGQFKDGKRHGYGSYQFASGDRYEGEYKDGRRDGYGSYQFKKGDRYVGYFHKGKYHRWGAYFFANGDKYFGQYENGSRNGKGTLACANGERYEGEFKDGKRHGLGRCTFENGDRYAGSWKNNDPDGWGTYYYFRKEGIRKENNGATPQNPSIKDPVAVDHSQNNLSQETREALLSGDAFLAEALQLEQNTATNPSNVPLVASLPPLRSTDGDEPLTPTLRELPGGDSYVGQLRDGQPHGQGAYLFSDGERYVGDFLHGRHHGQGLLVLPDGSRYLGEWKDGQRHGYGVLYDPEGHVAKEGHWSKDEPVED